jgi:hypothetical protein
VSQAAAAPRDAGSDRPRRDVEGDGYLGIVEAGHVPEDDRGPELLGKIRQRGIDVELAADRLVGVGPRRSAHDVIGAVLVLWETRCRASAPASQLVETGVGRDPVGPGRELGPAVEPRKALHDGDERFLGRVESVGVVAGQPPTDGVDPILVLAQQPIEGALVTRLSRFDQRGIVELDRDARTLPVGADSIMEVQVIVTSWMVSRFR